VDAIATPYSRINQVESLRLDKLLTRRFPLGHQIGRNFYIEDIVDDRWRGIHVDLDTGGWHSPVNPDLHGDSFASLFAAVDHDGDLAAAERWLTAAVPTNEPIAPPDAEWWLTRDIKPPEALLGEVITTTSRTLIGGPTGIGKSHLALAMAASMATGRDFAHWQVNRPVKTLYVDGEMPRDLVQSLLKDLKARMDDANLSNLLVLCLEDFEELGPLNTTEGRLLILAKVESWGAEAVFFDSRMSLTAGDMKDEEGWLASMQLVKDLSKRRVAQVWLDHTGHETGRIYGTKTKEWSFDNVALLTKAGQPGEISFTLEFTKARRRRPETRADFATVTFTLDGNQWTTVTAAAAKAKVKMSPMCAQFFGALTEAFIDTPGSTTRRAWYDQCVRLGLAEPLHTDDTYRQKDAKQRKFRKYMAELKAAWLIGVDGETVNDLRKRDEDDASPDKRAGVP
jgi:hypothetical protein